MWDASDSVLGDLRSPLGVLNVQHNKVDLVLELLLNLQVDAVITSGFSCDNAMCSGRRCGFK